MKLNHRVSFFFQEIKKFGKMFYKIIERLKMYVLYISLIKCPYKKYHKKITIALLTSKQR